MQIHYKKSDIFIPEWNDNKKQPAGEQIKFHHTFISAGERDEFIYFEPFTEGKMQILYSMSKPEMTDEDGEKVLEKNDRKFIQDKQGIAKRVTTKIENLEMVDDENKKVHKIDTIEKFYDAPDAFPGLKGEYEAYCIELTARADTKN